MPILDNSLWLPRVYGLDDPRVVGALAAETSAGGLPALRAGAATAGVDDRYLARQLAQLLATRHKEHRHAQPQPHLPGALRHR